MKRIFSILILSGSVIVDAQVSDTIVQTDGTEILCDITTVEGDKIYFTIAKDIYHSKKGKLSRKSVRSFALGGVSNLVFEDNVAVIPMRSKSDLVATATSWFTNPCEGVQKRTDYIDSGNGWVSGRFNIIYSSLDRSMISLRTAGVITFDVSVEVTETGYHYVFSRFYHESNSKAPGGEISFGRITTANECFLWETDGTQDWKNNTWKEIKNLISVKVNILLSELKRMMQAK